MEPTYFIENRYSFVVDGLQAIRANDYELETPETAFERSIQRELAAANRLIMEGKFSAALAQYLHLRGVIGAVINPRISVPNGALIDWVAMSRTPIIDIIVAKSAELLKKTPITESSLPLKFRSSEVTLPDPVSQAFAIFEEIGVKDRDTRVGVLLDEAETLVESRNFTEALRIFQVAFQETDDHDLHGAIMHDVAVVQERVGNRDQAFESMKRSAVLFGEVNNHESEVTVLTDLAGAQARAGALEESGATLQQVEELRKTHNLFPIVTKKASRRALDGLSLERSLPALERRIDARWIRDEAVSPTPFAGLAAAQENGETGTQPVQLMATDAFAARKTQKQFTILDTEKTPHRILLDNNATQNLTAFYEQLSSTRDLGLLMGYLTAPTITVAYLTHIYFWVIPMGLGDCYAALGSYQEAEAEYLSTLNYQYINQVVESTNLWLRLAELYLDWGDRLYRQARNVIAEFGPAKEKYELVVRLDNSLDPESPLYKSEKFATLRDRATAAVQAMFVDNTAIEENPRFLSVFLRARMQLTKIANGLNFIGLGLHIPPFSFEYLQNLARYFAQHASQVEQMYIQFKSTGENEQLREQQMAQQVEIASASVELERRGRGEAQEGVDVAQANLNHANVQAQNATQSANDFNNVRWELLELDTLQAWASASSVDRDDQVKLTITGYTYYSADDKRRNVVLKELANQRTRIAHNLEANRLQREINAANAYRGVAQQQVQQAQARVAIAQQRVAIAQMQEQNARENLQFLQGREFSSGMWYNLARESRRLAERYLDMAIEVATMMEKAYEAETGRDLRKIKFEYGLNHLNGLLGAEALLLDIDFFSLDYVRTKSKKAQMRQTISLADHFPMAFSQMLSTGTAYFETTLEHFDRRYPGFYLQKVKQVEVVLVGLNGSEGVHGTLRNIGISQFRIKDGSIVNQTYPADIMPLSEYNVRQDAIIFQLDSKELRLFENNGVATMWQLNLPLATNTFDLRQILDIQMVVYYDGFFDAGLEQQILASLPTSGSVSRGLSLRMYAPDELFFLRSQGSAELQITPDLFPANHTNQVLSSYSIQAQGTNVAGLKVRVEFADLGSTHTFELDASGIADGASFPTPLNQSLFGKWIFTIDPAENPGFDLSGLTDLSVFLEYDFDYRS
jgi:hypothetical protein